jgi:hypothetical protein
VNNSRARINLGEHHVKGDLHITYHITVGYLNVLNFSCIGLSFIGFNTDQLDFNRFNHEFRILGNNESIESLVEGTVSRVDGSLESELRNLLSWAYFEAVRRNHEIFGDILATDFRIDTCSGDGAIELFRTFEIFSSFI